MTSYEDALYDICKNHYSLVNTDVALGFLPKCNVNAYVERIPYGYKLHHVSAKHNKPNTHTVTTYVMKV